MTQVRLKCKICGKEETIEITSPKRFDPENDIEFRHGKCIRRKTKCADIMFGLSHTIILSPSADHMILLLLVTKSVCPSLLTQ